jgi:hypothetical protein
VQHGKLLVGTDAMTAKEAITYLDTAQALENAATDAIAHTDVVLDIGCGIRPMTRFEPKVHLCLEPFEPYTAILQRRFARAPGVVPLKIAALDGLALLPDRSVDSIFLLDVIEHMPKEYGISVLQRCERVARRQIVVATPLGFMPQDHEAGEMDGWGVSHNKLQDHLSGWEPDDFGAGWRFLVCPTYHTNDAKGRRLAKPFGSFYAIRDIPALLRSLPVKPLLIGASVPPAPVNGKVREEILAIFEGFDQSQLRIFSSYDARPYSPYYNIPNLLEFSTRRLDGEYHHVRFPDGWAELAADPPKPRQLRREFARFLEPFVESCRSNGHHPVLLCDFAPVEQLLAYYLAVSAGTRTLFLSSRGYPVEEIAQVFQSLPHERLNLEDGVDKVRAAIFAEQATTPPSLLERDHLLLRGLRRVVRRLGDVG